MTIRWHRTMWCALAMLASVVAPPAAGQLVFPGGTDTLTTVEDAFGIGHTPVIVDGSGRSACRWRYMGSQRIPKGIYRVGFFTVSPFPGLTELGLRIVLEDGSGERIVLDFADFQFECMPFAPSHAKDARTPDTSEKASTPLSNAGDSFAVTCDGRYSVIVGSPQSLQQVPNSKPVSLVDNANGVEIAALAYPNQLGRAVAIGDDGQTVLVLLDNAINTVAGTVHRLVLSPGGTLTDSGASLGFAGAFVRKIEIAPGSKVGVALLDQSFTNAGLISFSLPGLAIIDGMRLTGRVGHALVFDPSGTKVYARTGGAGADADGDTIEGFDIDATGHITHTARLTITGVSTFYGTVLHYPMAISPDGARLLVAEGNDRSRVPPRITSFSTSTGAILSTSTASSWTPASPPQTVGAHRACAISRGVDVIEYYNATLDHYFISWLPAEWANLDKGRTPTRWNRTGYAFRTHLNAQTGTSPVCRFYIPPGLGDSHFFGRGIDECSATGQRNPTFVLEDPAFMQMFLPVAGVCPANTTPVYRAFSNRADANHRYMIDRAVRAQMVAQGWVAEGDGPDLVVMCAPQ